MPTIIKQRPAQVRIDGLKLITLNDNFLVSVLFKDLSYCLKDKSTSLFAFKTGWLREIRTL